MNFHQRGREQVGALILAAGLSTRMGRPKMLLPWADATVIQIVVKAYLDEKIAEIVVVTGGARTQVEEALRGLPVKLVFNPLYENGEMLDSLKIGLNSFSQEIQAILIAPGDLPGIGVKEIEMVLKGYLSTDKPLIVPSFEMRRGHPWMVERKLWSELMALETPRTLRTFLQEQAADIQYVDADNASILMDMDTPEDYERLRQEKPLPEKVQCWRCSPTAGLEKMRFESGTAPQNFDQASFLIPSGPYTTFRTYEKFSVFHLSSHLDRLEETARLSSLEIQLDRKGMRAAIRAVLDAALWPECRVRVTLDLGSPDLPFYIFAEELFIPSAKQYSQGVNAAIVQTHRENPRAKLSSFLPLAKYYREQAAVGVYEFLMSSENGEILEGLSSNFFGVQAGKLRTAGQGVLEGITRTSVLEAARDLGISLLFDAVGTDEIDALDEAFITSSSRGILPVSHIDSVVIGSGKPGPITKRLNEEFNRRLADGLEKVQE